jgi:hypothetical protein
MTVNAIALKSTFALRAATAEMMSGSDCAQVLPVESWAIGFPRFPRAFCGLLLLTSTLLSPASQLVGAVHQQAPLLWVLEYFMAELKDAFTHFRVERVEIIDFEAARVFVEEICLAMHVRNLDPFL